MKLFGAPLPDPFSRLPRTLTLLLVTTSPRLPPPGGQAVRVALAANFYARPHLLILDEPSNHLDLEGVECMVAALHSFAGAVLLVSHDQARSSKGRVRPLRCLLGWVCRRFARRCQSRVGRCLSMCLPAVPGAAGGAAGVLGGRGRPEAAGGGRGRLCEAAGQQRQKEERCQQRKGQRRNCRACEEQSEAAGGPEALVCSFTVDTHRNEPR